MNQLTLTLKPRWENGTVADMTVFASLPAALIPQGPAKPALQYPALAYGGRCPFAEYEIVSISDENGSVRCHLDDIPCFYDSADCKGIFLERPVSGTLRWTTRLFPRVLPEGYQSSPYFDFRAEPLGLNGCGLFAFLLPDTGDTPLSVHFDWDLSEMPKGARGIWSYGEGPVDIVLTSWQVRMTLFNTGVMHSNERGGLGVYWFSDPPVDVDAIAGRLYPIYQYMKDYFHDTESCFRVFLRRDPFERSGGGSACPYSFISGYSAFGGIDEESWFNVLIHEMTHTWPSMEDSEEEDTAWFSEGCTEFYSTLLPYRGGFLDADVTARAINEKITGCYLNNPYRLTPNRQLPQIQWQDIRAQKIPYGRGFLYLANVDARLRRLKRGSIDDFVSRYSILKPALQDEWIRFVQDRLGESGVREFRDMADGKLVIPEEGLFGADILTVQDEITLDGKQTVSWHWEARHDKI